MIRIMLEKLKEKPFSVVLIQSIIILLFSNVVTHLVFPMWQEYNGIFHSSMELVCIIIAANLFLVVWCRYYSNSVKNQIIALGFLAIAIFDVLHTFYFTTLGFSPKNYFDLSVRFWIVSRITEAILLLIITTNLSKIKINKWIGVSGSLIYSIGISYLMVFHKNLFPILYTSNGITNIKILFEYCIIFILIAAAWNLKGKISNKDTFTYKYIAITILIFIPAEICFTTYKTFTDFVMAYGHVLKVTYYICLFKGIVKTEMDYPYLKLDEVNKRLRDILNAIPLAIHTYDKELRITFANKRFEELLQCKSSNIVGLTMTELLKKIKKIDREDENELPSSLIEKGISVDNIVRTYKTLEGNSVKLLVNIHKIENGVMFISKEAACEQAIENLNLQTETILNSMLYPAMILNNQGIITACNVSFQNLIDLDKDDIIGSSLVKINKMINFDNEEIVNKFFGGNLYDEYYEASLVSIKGIKRKITGQVSPIYNVENKKIGIISVMQDVTELQNNQERLINQEKLALLGQMGASIVHDTRNFLTTINGSCQLIELYSDDVKIKECAKRIKMDTDEINRIMSDFLTLAKPANIAVEEVSVYDLLSSVKNLLQTSSLIKGINIEFNFNHDERYLMCDQVRIRQVILNICKNAIEAMENVEQPVLKIQTDIDEFTNEIYVEITDNGAGIPKEIISKLGTPFFTTKENGTGLGLSSCFQIIGEHKGKIEVKSELNVGTTFNIILPCISDEDVDEKLI
ncbi:MASE3 domain-containing protein [Clostridium kluyveri]|uniref:MASE3 domain-containing protein n=1 Tax=Clostridium kluyveri TaxID=1534 RepID=UPI0022450A46|nr:MASE3 domain-containing protein [Clostridium kluyveri]UZQ49301.1 ATP-binding protein [Clostridium kluyveri]